MNAVILFLLSLCSVWLQPSGNSSVLHNHGAVIVKTQTAVDKKIDFSNFENEDEDDDQSIGSKYVLLAKCIVSISFSAALLIPFYYLNNLLPFSKNIYNTSSPKYILQRVLRL